VTALVVVACWTPPLIEEFTSSNEGNLSRILGNASSLHSSLGAHDALRLFAGVTAVPFWWLRWSMTDIYTSLPWIDVTVIWLAVLAAVLGLCAWDGWRRRDRVVTSAVATAAIAGVVGYATVVKAPVEDTGRASGYQTRLLWPLAAFMFLAVLVTLFRRVRGPRSSTVLGAVTLIATATVVGFNVPTASAGSHAPDFTQRGARDLYRQVGDLEHRGRLFVAFEIDSFHYQFYASGLIGELRRRHVPFVVSQPFLVRQLGEHRRFNGANADAVVTLHTGDDRVETPPPGARRVAVHYGLSPRQRREFSVVKQQIAEYIRAGQLRLNDQGKRAMERLGGSRSSPSTAPQNGFDPDKLFASRGLMALFEHGFLVLDDEWLRRFVRYDYLQWNSDSKTVAVFVAPLIRHPGGPARP
jgi:hypothetical protein